MRILALSLSLAAGVAAPQALHAQTPAQAPVKAPVKASAKAPAKAPIASAVAAPVKAPAAPPAPVFCGSFTCFMIRVPAEGMTAEARALHAMDTINKYLGGKAGKVTTKPAGKNIRLLLNNELLAVVTPADAAVEKQNSVAATAAKWSKQLSVAFNATKAQPG
ncbi:MAG TPA: hypothetical protein VK689_16125 [Armatimonadota bacterium]|nr:hypothetical protein [Armatimonadota bacterium]